MNTSNLVSGPHTHAPVSVPWIMRQVMLALLPVTAFGIYLFGWPALNLLIIAVLTAVAAEALCLSIAGKPIRPFLNDGSAVLTGWLIALTLPPWAPWWIPLVGVSFAIIVGKHVFGGIGQNVFNPAMLARVMLLVAFPLEMTTWIAPGQLFSGGGPGFFEGLAITFGGIPNLDAVSSATPLGEVKTALTLEQTVGQALANYHLTDSILGWSAGSLGETSAVLILLGGLFMLLRGVITWHTPVAMLATSFLLASGFNFLDPDRYVNGFYHIFNGGAMLVAFFIATDPVTAPTTRQGRILFGMGVGLIEYLIRTWGSFPEGVGFGILLMNALTPLIDHYVRPRIYGRTLSGKPLKVESPQSSR